MSVEQRTDAMLRGLCAAGVDFIVVDGEAAVLQGAMILTQDLDIVHRRSPENVARLLPWLLAHDAHDRADLASRRITPTQQALLGQGHVLLQTSPGKLDILCELGDGEGFEELVADTVFIETGDARFRVLALARLIAVKGRAG